MEDHISPLHVVLCVSLSATLRLTLRIIFQSHLVLCASMRLTARNDFFCSCFFHLFSNFFSSKSSIEKFASEDADLDMTIVHADASTLVKNLMDDNKDAQVSIYNGLTKRLKNAKNFISILLIISLRFHAGQNLQLFHFVIMVFLIIPSDEILLYLFVHL